VGPTETGRVELRFTGDARILAGVCGAVNHLAEVAGMDEPGRAALVAAIEDVCQEALHLFPNNDGPIEMSLAAVNGQIETTMTLHGVAGQAGGAEKVQRTLTGRIDRVTQDARGDTIRLTLLKNLGGRSPKT
jgi:hypothetical protein